MHLRIVYHADIALAEKIDKSNPGILAKTKPNTGVSEPRGDVVVAARAGEEGTEMKTIKSNPRPKRTQKSLSDARDEGRN